MTRSPAARPRSRCCVGLALLAALIAAAPASAARTRDFLKKPVAWFASAEARRIAENLLSYQSDYGGWPKNLDLTAAPFAGGKGELIGNLRPIFDNGATTDEIRFLARVFAATGEDGYRRAVEEGLDYILITQYPSGGWPQGFPTEAPYQKFITFNDDAMVHVLALLREVTTDPIYTFLDQPRRAAADAAFWRGIQCILRCQVVQGDRRTAWGAQHDSADFRPREARRFELAALSGAESVKIVRLLMSLERPAPEVIAAIEAAVAWLEKVRITGWRVEPVAGDEGPGRHFTAVADPGAPPLWARFYDLKSGQPLFADLDAVPHLGIANVGWARRGYDWTGQWAQRLLDQEYPQWKARLAQQGAGPALPAWQPRLRVALAGDSTVTDAAGWGFGFKKQLSPDVLCENFAQGGQSSKSFRDTGWWARALAAQPDYVLIQFGHNDMPGKGPHRETDPATTYPENLVRFVAEARAAGVQPILLTSLTRRTFLADGTLRRELAPYAEAVRKVAAEQQVPLIDLYALSIARVEQLGPAGVAPLEPSVPAKPAVPPAGEAPPPGELKNPRGDIDSVVPEEQWRRDATHLNGAGSREFGALVAGALGRLVKDALRR